MKVPNSMREAWEVGHMKVRDVVDDKEVINRLTGAAVAASVTLSRIAQEISEGDGQLELLLRLVTMVDTDVGMIKTGISLGFLSKLAVDEEGGDGEAVGG